MGDAWERTRTDAVAFGLLIAVVLLVPIATAVVTMPFSGRTVLNDTYDLPKSITLAVLASLALVVWSAGVLREERPVRSSRAMGWLLALLGWIAVSSAFSITPLLSVFGQYQRREGLATWMLYAVVFFLAVQLVRDTHRVRGIAMALVGVGIPVCGYAIAQALGYDPVAWKGLDFAGRAFSTFGNPETLAGFLLFALPLAAGLALEEQRRVMRLMWWAAAALSLGSLALTFTRGAWLGALLGLALFALLARGRGVRLDRVPDTIAAIAGAGVLAAITLATASSANAETNLWLRATSLLRVAEGSGHTRLHLWRAALAAVGERPVTGFGPDTFRLVFPAVRDDGFFVSAPLLAAADNAHSLPLQLASTIGLVGLALFIGVLVSVARQAWPQVKPAEESGSAEPRGRVLLAAFFAASAAYLVNLLFGLSEAGTTSLLWIALGVLCAPSAVSKSLRRPVVIRAGVVAACGAALAFTLGSAVLASADIRYLHARMIDNGDDRVAEAVAAARMAPHVPEYLTEVGNARFSAAMDAAAARVDAGQPVPRDTRAEFETGAQALEDAIETTPWDPVNYELLARMYNFGGVYLGPEYPRRAVEVTSRGLARFPVSPSLLFERGAALAAIDDTVGAQRDLRRALDLEPRRVEAAILLSRLLARDGRPGDALAVLEACRTYGASPPAIEQAIEYVKQTSP